MKIKWVFFDVDNTLFDTKELAHNARLNAVKAMIDAGLPAKSVNLAYNKLKNIINREGSNYGSHFNELCSEYKVKVGTSKIVAAGVVAYHNTKFAYLKPFPSVMRTLIQLSDIGYGMGIITNGRAVKQWDKLIRLGIHHFFKVAVISEEVGYEKPSENMFQEALKTANCKPQEAVMVGDKEEDIAAKDIGMITICIGKVKEADFKIKSFDEILGVVERLG